MGNQMELKVNKKQKVCKKCKWYPRILNATSDDIPICKCPLLSGKNYVSGCTTYTYCSFNNGNGDCSHYQKR